MKKLLVSGLLAAALIMPGCIDGRPPDFPVPNPCTVPDGSGGSFITYTINDKSSYNTFVQRLDAEGRLLWDGRGTDLGPGSGARDRGDFAALLPDGNGNITVVYSYQGHAVRAMKLDASGNPVWPDREIVSADEIPPMPVYFQAVGDAAGGAIIAWLAVENNLGLEKIDSSGATVWSSHVTTTGLDAFDVAADADGNTLLAWKTNPGYSQGDIFVQKVDGQGRVAWEEGGLQLNEDGPENTFRGIGRRIAGDGSGGMLALWAKSVAGENGTTQQFYVQRIGSGGERMWGRSGVLITEGFLYPCLIGDNTGSALVCWQDSRAIYTQRIDTTGNLTWADGGVDVQRSSQAGINYYYAAADGAGGGVFVWDEREDDESILRAQRVDAGGNRPWGDNGITVSSARPYWSGLAVPARIAPDGTGSYLVTFAAGKSIRDKTSSYIQRISAGGALLWGEDGIKLD